MFAELEPQTMSWTEVWSQFRYFPFSSVLSVCPLHSCVRGQTETWGGRLWSAILRPFPFNIPGSPKQVCPPSSFLTSLREQAWLFPHVSHTTQRKFPIEFHLPLSKEMSTPCGGLSASPHLSQHQVTASCTSRFHSCFFWGFV